MSASPTGNSRLSAQEPQPLSVVHADQIAALTTIFEYAAVGMALTRDGVIVASNRRLQEILKLDAQALSGESARALFPSDKSYRYAMLQAAPKLAAGTTFSADWPLQGANEEPQWVQLYARAIDPANPESGVVWIFDDMSDRQSTRTALGRALLRMEALMTNAPVGVVITHNHLMTRFNDRFVQMFGYRREELLNASTRIIYRNDDDFLATRHITRPLLQAGKPVQHELYLRRKDGSEIWVNLIGFVENPLDATESTFWILEDRSATNAAEEETRRLAREQQLILDHSVVGIAFLKDRVIQRCNRRFEEIYGWPAGTMQGQSTRITYYSDETYERVGATAYSAINRGETFALEVVCRRRDNEPVWLRITGKAINPLDPAAGSIWNYEDITARKLAEESARKTEILQQAILDSAQLAIISTDSQGRIVSINPATEQLLGYGADDLMGQRPNDAFLQAETIANNSQLSADAFSDDVLFGHARLGEVMECECVFRRKDGSTFPVQLSISALSHGGEEHLDGFLLVAADISVRKRAEEALRRSHSELEARVKERTQELESEISERKQAESRLRHLAHHDTLTDLPNRAALRQHIEHAIALSNRENQLAAVYFIDLDRFKNINDSLGHHAGDALLVEVANRLRGTLRSNDTVARLGGDEFVVVTPLVDSPGSTERMADKLLEALRPPCMIEGHEVFVTPSVGVCLYPIDGSNADTLLRNADTAMYKAKETGRNNYQRFDPAMTEATEQYFQIESSLRRAVEREEFEVHYQPIIALGSGKVSAFEALVRWRHPQLGVIAPSRFIPVAEETGLIIAIGERVLEIVCAQWRDWEAAGYRPPPICVNVSAVQFRVPDIANRLSQIVADAGIPAEAVELELTESALMQNCEHTLTTLETLASRGFQLSIDDFGTGYSSLAYLKRFPVSKLKVDRSFIKDMTDDKDDEAIVATVIALSRTLGLAVVAEGAETIAQIERLKKMGCDSVQGFFYARPAPAEQIAAAFLQRPI